MKLNAETGAADPHTAEELDEIELQRVVDQSIQSPVPASVSRRQLILGLAGLGMITGEDALAAAQTGAVPVGIDAYFSMLPDDQALAARITWASMTEARRDHPLIAALALANGLSSVEIDDAFRAWALI
ncbi:MAG TPA: hypothetical protein PL187_24430 [Caldilinea sp.]|nr:hypothetical protein [Caldilinea sp.]